MSSKKRVKVAVTGAAGQIGYSLLFRIASGQMFGPEVEVELQLLELEKTLPALNGVAMELDDCAFPLLKKITCTSQLDVAFNGINWALLVGAIPRGPGMERGDLLKVNGGIFGPQGASINKHADSSVQVLVVGNPCNTNCFITMKHAPDVPQERFFAMTMLDELRATTQLAQKAKVDVSAISQMTIWGNHSATQYPDFYNAKINGKPAHQVINDEKWLQEDFISTVQKRGAAIIAARGSSSAASAANAIVQSVYKLTHSQSSFSVCKASIGEYGVDKELIFGFPCYLKDNKVTVVEGLTHNSFGSDKIQKTLEELRSERKQVEELGLV